LATVLVLSLSPGPGIAKPKALSPGNRLPLSAAGLAPGSGNTATPLSATECGKLGGTLQSYSVCKSNVVCTFRDQYKKVHAVCVTSLFHD
jgi:hypothetical protein